MKEYISGVKRKVKFLLDQKIWKYTVLTVRPAFIGLLGALLWNFIHPYFVPMWGKDATDWWLVILGFLIALLGTIHGFIAANQVMNIVKQRDKMLQAYNMGKEKEFYEYECIRIQPYIKIGLFFFSLLFWIIFLLCPFPTILAGMFVEWLVIFILYFIWEIAAEAEDPYHGIVYLNKAEVEAKFEKIHREKKAKKKRKREEKYLRNKQILKDAITESRHYL